MTATAAQLSSARGRSRTRIGSDEAQKWARKLRLHNPYAKSILRAVANYMNEEGSAYPGIETLHLDTDIAEDTIISRLRWCESIGAIALFKCWVDENGRRNHDGRGRTTSTEIRFLFDADLDDIEAKALGSAKPKVLRGAALASHQATTISSRPDGEQTEEISSRPDGQLNPISPGLAPEQPPTRADRREELEPKEDSPLPPKGGDAQHSHEFENRKLASWSRFETAWHEPILRQSIARQVWWALTEAEEEIAIKAAKGYVVHRRSQTRPPSVINAHTFLKERDAWAGFAAKAPPDVLPTAPPMFEAEGSESWQARRVIAAIRDDPDAGARHIEGHGKGDLFRKQLSPQSLALAQFAIEHEGKIDTREWLIVKAGTNPCGAWREFLGVDPYNVRTGETKRTEILGRVYENWPVTIHGIRVPCEYPPRKDGTMSATGPPVAA